MIDAHVSPEQRQPPPSGAPAGVVVENKDGSFTFKLVILPQTKFQLRYQKPAVKEEAAAE